jgi:hypothetical protein
MQLFLTLTTMGSFIPERLILVNLIYRLASRDYLCNLYLIHYILSLEFANESNGQVLTSAEAEAPMAAI